MLLMAQCDSLIGIVEHKTTHYVINILCFFEGGY